MGTTREEIGTWFDRGVANKQAYMIVWCDTYDDSDYPDYHPDREKAQRALNNPGNMTRAMEVYDLNGSRSAQLASSRAWALRTGSSPPRAPKRPAAARPHDERVSVSQRPSTQALMQEMVDASDLSKTELYNCGVDTLHFLWSVLRRGGEVGVKFPGDKEFTKTEIFIPGLIRRGWTEGATP